ncbi:MAG: NUDIX hydrolase [Thaumarchaeota archaeon]|jgi:ADP-ribose pyrophosphatase|nr:NUDIX hydrolase [Candidatus Terraquivivens yellowstonensis]MCL7397789.1 NUDIX hydrolase [Candidatus Terraquivivens yellowstonensis]MCL7399223.1 NUDIX hydrolase [Candidatus Terraquivivens yellowstonensis]
MGKEYPKMPVVAVGALILQDHNILLVKRVNEPGKGKWSIPGGTVELGESLKDAVVREVYEETGLVVEVLELLDIIEVIRKDDAGNIAFHYVILDYLARPVGGNLRAASDASDVLWASVDEAMNMEITESLRAMLRKLKEKGFFG